MWIETRGGWRAVGGTLPARFSCPSCGQQQVSHRILIAYPVPSTPGALMSNTSSPVAIDDRIGAGPGSPGLVSVIIPTYNRASVIEETLESVLAQTYKSIEILVIDDGSVDSTREVVERFGPPVFYHHQANGGVSSARNHGLRKARGEFVALLDSDDLWHSWKIEAQVRFLERHPEVGMVWTDMRAIDTSGKLIRERYLKKFYAAYNWVSLEKAMTRGPRLGEVWPQAPQAEAAAGSYTGDLFAQMIMGNLVHTSTVLMRRSRLVEVGGFDESLKPAGEDYDFHLRTCSVGPVALLDVPSMDYRIGAEDQVSAPKHDIHFARSNLRTVEKWLTHSQSRVRLPRRLIVERLAHANGWVGEEEMQAGNRRVARKYLFASLSYDPWQPRKALFALFSLVPTGFFNATRRLLRVTKAVAGWSPGHPGA